MNPLEKAKSLISNLLGSKQTYYFGDWEPHEKAVAQKTGPGFTEPMQQPKGAPKASPKPSPSSDPFSGYNKQRGLPNKEISSLIIASAQKYNIHPALLAAILFNESGFNPKAVNQNGPGNIDRGIAQINSSAFPEVGDAQAYDPNFSVEFAAKLLRQNMDHFGGDVNRGIASYNVGRGGANVRGPEPFGGGPTGQGYLDRVSLNLTPDFADSLGIKYSQGIFGR